MKIKIGNGIKRGSAKTIPIGTLSANMEKTGSTRTLRSIAKQVARQINLKNGFINIVSVEFIYEK
jgi:hypothetical protein